jgi:hypothetical protein
MSQRNRKRVVIELFHHRFYNLGFMWRSAEESDWLNFAPVGREFGSPDYERLMQEDAEKLRAKLAKLVAECSADTAAVPEASEFAQDTINIQRALTELGHAVNLDVAAKLWKHHSSSLMAGWMSGAQSVASARTGILCYCAMSA